MSSPNVDRPTVPAKPKRSAANALRRKHAQKRALGISHLEQLFRLSPFSPPWTGFLFAISSIALVTLLEIISGRMDQAFNLQNIGDFGYFFLVLHLMLLAYIPTAVVVLAREARRNAHALTHLVEPSDDVRVQLARVGTYPLKGYIIAGMFGLIIGLLAPNMDVDVWRDHLYNPLDFSIYTPEVWAQRVIALTFGFFAGVLPYAAMVEGWRFNRLARNVTNTHVMDPVCLVPFTRQGLFNVLIVAGFPAIFSLFLINGGLIYIVIGVAIFAVVFAACGLIWPLTGIHSRIAGAKREQLVWVNRELAEAKNALQGGDGTRFTSLMAYRTYIEAVREWPLDGSTISRLAFYLAIPAFSWSGAAIVERMIDTALG